MKKRYLIVGLLVFILSNCVSANQPTGKYTSPWTGGSNSSDLVPVLIIFFLALIVIVGIIVYFAHAQTQRVHDRYDEELRRLDGQLKDGHISEEAYKELKRNLEKKYKHYT